MPFYQFYSKGHFIIVKILIIFFAEQIRIENLRAADGFEHFW